jgi:fibronectin-binding autotransporter adhesin
MVRRIPRPSGVIIQAGAQFTFNTVGDNTLALGTVFTAISNTAATPISGTFANLADGLTVTIGANKLQVIYAGGDGNDLTLTVMP